ncbi:hypothetical protein BUALT_Bualt19G0024900 [Buddleja alternifolia]|uniref:PGG domain-containing protein n=1 Tax=Buddleja alternifolia TaxID=168488 RepID=A0AAV6VZM8_9LAMI|nr:hypothetical protein BUALT_Bualt19G0024900 [Buddleja alternifolia]
MSYVTSMLKRFQRVKKSGLGRPWEGERRMAGRGRKRKGDDRYARVPSQSIVIYMLSLLVRVWGKAGLGGAREPLAGILGHRTAGTSHVVSEPTLLRASHCGRRETPVWCSIEARCLISSVEALPSRRALWELGAIRGNRHAKMQRRGGRSTEELMLRGHRVKVGVEAVCAWCTAGCAMCTKREPVHPGDGAAVQSSKLKYARVPSQSIVIHMLSLLVRVWGKAGLGGAREPLAGILGSRTAGSSHPASYNSSMASPLLHPSPLTSCAGDTTALNQLLQQKPFILSDTAMITSIENILNIAIKSANIQLSTEIARSDLHILTVQDRDGVRPLDVASAYGLVEMVRELLIVAPNPAEICRLPGRDGKSAIHHASINGRVDVIDELMEKCPDCVRDVTSFGETALHLAVKYYKFEAVKSLLQWLERVGIMEVVNSKDKDGNTVLHYAASRKQLEIVELLLDQNTATRNVIEVDAKNSNGLTAMDLLSIFIESSSDSRLKQILQDARGGSGGAAPPSPPTSVPVQQPSSSSLPVNRKIFKFDYERESPSEMRNALLVVAALFVTLAYQGLINLPTHIFRNDQRGDGDYVQVLYLVATNCLLLASVSMMRHLTLNIPFKAEIFLAFCSLSVSNVCSMSRISTLGFEPLLIVVFIPCLLLSLRLIAVLLRIARKHYNNRNSTA